MEAWRTVQGWLTDWTAPEAPTPIDPEGATGACVTIRLDNIVLARAQDVADDDLSLYRAARTAIAQARERAPLERSEDFEQRLRVLADSLTLDIQIAGAFTPLLGDSFDEAALHVGPGLDGVGVRSGERMRVVFPATMLAQNATPASALSSAAAELLNEPVNIPGRDLKALREHRALVPYRFESLHLAQIAPGREPVFLTRGGRVIPPTDVTRSSLREFADRLAEHLRSRVDERGTMAGAYEPWNDGHTSVEASAHERALVAFALARYASSPFTAPARSLAASRGAWTLLDTLTRETGEDPVAAGAFLIALHEARTRPTDLDPARQPDEEAIERAMALVRGSYGESGWAPATASSSRALLTYAAARVAARRPDVISAEHARAMLGSVLRETPPGQMVALMPWALWAELELASGHEPIAWATALAEMRALIWQHQVSLADSGTIAPDLVGGIVFTAGPSPLPTWQTARPLPALAAMLADARLTRPEERPEEFARLLLSMRFLRQLAADEAVVHLFPNPERALWGVREAPWNHRQPADASAMALLAVTESLRATSPSAPRKP